MNIKVVVFVLSIVWNSSVEGKYLINKKVHISNGSIRVDLLVEST